MPLRPENLVCPGVLGKPEHPFPHSHPRVLTHGHTLVSHTPHQHEIFPQVGAVTSGEGDVTGLEKDWDAVLQGLSTRWNSGPVEGRVNHIKMVSSRTAGPRNLTRTPNSWQPR